MGRESFNKRLLDAIVKGVDKKSVPAKVVRGEGMSESEIQQSCLRWFALQYPVFAREGMLFHIPNEGIRLGGMGAKMVREGIVRGVADLCLCIPRGGYHALYIEMKRPGSYQRPEQKEWQKNCEKYGNLYVVCRSLEEFREIVTKYLNGELVRTKNESK